MTVMPFTIFGVIEPGVPNLERVALKAIDYGDLSEFGMLVGTSTPDLKGMPFPDMFCTLGHGLVYENDWVFLYTGHGTPSIQNLDNGSRLINVFWKRNSTVFYRPGIVPIIFRIAAYTTLPPPPEPMPLPQFGPVSVPPPPPNKLAGLINSETPTNSLLKPRTKP